MQKFRGVNGHELLARVKTFHGRDSFKINVRRFFVTSAGTVVNKNTVASVYQTGYPVNLFNNFDSQGGYANCQQLTPPKIMKYFFGGIYKNYYDIFSFAGANTIRQHLRNGDYLQIYVDDLDFPSLYCWIVISADDAAYGSLLRNPPDTGIDIRGLMFFSDSEKQYNENVQHAFIDMHDIKSDSLAPYAYRSINDQQESFINYNIEFKLHNFNGINFYMNFNADLLTLIFKYKKDAKRS